LLPLLPRHFAFFDAAFIDTISFIDAAITTLILMIALRHFLLDDGFDAATIFHALSLPPFSSSC